MDNSLEKQIESEITRLKKAQADIQESFKAAGYQIGILQYMLNQYRNPKPVLDKEDKVNEVTNTEKNCK